MGSDLDANDRLSDDEITALREALDDEYRAHAIYTQVVADFGADVLPFANIVESEARHVDALLGLFRRYGLDIPDNPWPGTVERYASVADACRAGVEGTAERIAALVEPVLSFSPAPDDVGVRAASN